MLKWFFEKANVIKITLVSIVVGAILFCFNMFPCGQTTLEMAFLEARDGLSYTVDGEYHADVFFCTIIIFILIAIVCQTFTNDYETAKSYLFIRMNGAKRWYRIKMLQSLFYTFYSQVVYNAVLLLMTYVMRYGTSDIKTVVLYFLWCVFSGTLIIFLFIAAGNVMSLLFKPHLVVSGVVTLCMMIMVGTCFMNAAQVRYSPLVYYTVTWHIYQHKTSFYLTPYPAWVNYIIVFLVIVVICVAGEKLIKKKDHI